MKTVPGNYVTIVTGEIKVPTALCFVAFGLKYQGSNIQYRGYTRSLHKLDIRVSSRFEFC